MWSEAERGVGSIKNHRACGGCVFCNTGGFVTPETRGICRVLRTLGTIVDADTTRLHVWLKLFRPLRRLGMNAAHAALFAVKLGFTKNSQNYRGSAAAPVSAAHGYLPYRRRYFCVAEAC